MADALLEKLATTIRIELIDSLLPGGLSASEAVAQLRVYFPQMCHFAQETMCWEYALLEQAATVEQGWQDDSKEQRFDMLASTKTKLQSLVDFGTTLQNLHSSSQFFESHPQDGGASMGSKASAFFARGRSSLGELLGISRKVSISCWMCWICATQFC